MDNFTASCMFKLPFISVQKTVEKSYISNYITYFCESFVGWQYTPLFGLFDLWIITTLLSLELGLPWPKPSLFSAFTTLTVEWPPSIYECRAFSVMVRRCGVPAPFFKRRDKIFFNVYHQRISCLRTGTFFEVWIRNLCLMHISKESNDEMSNKQWVINEIFSEKAKKVINFF